MATPSEAIRKGVVDEAPGYHLRGANGGRRHNCGHRCCLDAHIQRNMDPPMVGYSFGLSARFLALLSLCTHHSDWIESRRLLCRQ